MIKYFNILNSSLINWIIIIFVCSLKMGLCFSCIDNSKESQLEKKKVLLVYYRDVKARRPTRGPQFKSKKVVSNCNPFLIIYVNFFIKPTLSFMIKNTILIMLFIIFLTSFIWYSFQYNLQSTKYHIYYNHEITNTLFDIKDDPIVVESQENLNLSTKMNTED